MEIAATLISGIGSLFGGGGAAAGAAAAGTAGSLLGSSGFLSIIQGGVTVLSAIGALREGQAQAEAANARAEEARQDAQMENIQGVERRTALKKQLLEDVGARDVAYAASGLDLSFGTPATAREGAISDANRALSTDADTEEMKRQRLMQRSDAYRRQAEEARSGGVLKAIGIGLGGLTSIARRG